jgi:hypothetical protein
VIIICRLNILQEGYDEYYLWFGERRWFSKDSWADSSDWWQKRKIEGFWDWFMLGFLPRKYILSGQQLLFVFLKQFLGSFFVPKVDRVIFFGLDSLFEQHLQFMFVLLEDG